MSPATRSEAKLAQAQATGVAIGRGAVSTRKTLKNIEKHTELIGGYEYFGTDRRFGPVLHGKTLISIRIAREYADYIRVLEEKNLNYFSRHFSHNSHKELNNVRWAV